MSNFSFNGTQSSECLLSLEYGIVMIIINIISSAIGSLGNVLVCATIHTTTAGLQTTNYVLISYMAVADLIVTAVAQPLFIGFLGATMAGSCASIVELLFRLAANTSCAVSVFFHLCMISVDRCRMVTRPYTFSRMMTKIRSRVMFLISWVLAIIYAVFRLAGSKRATSLFTVAVMVIVVMVIVISYTLIIIQIRWHNNLMQRKRDKMELHIAMAIGIVVIVFNLSWLPIIVLRSRNSDNSSTAYNLARTLALCNSAMNPWLFRYKIREFRVACRRLRIWCGACEGDSVTLGSA